jgi:hypothetical protein
MELLFVRHGEAEHRKQSSADYAVKDPKLTQSGLQYALELKKRYPLTEEDTVIAGPTVRTLQTARLWAEGTGCSRFVHPLAGPRQHPFRYDFHTLPCDYSLEPERIVQEFGDFLPASHLPTYLWLQGIHTLPKLLFTQQAERFLEWCGGLEKARVWVITHARTIQAFQELLPPGSERFKDEMKPVAFSNQEPWRWPLIG